MTRVRDRATFLYLDLCRIEQDDNGTHAKVEFDDGPRTTYLPTATLSCLMLGPGTSITAPAAAALARTGCSVLFTGSGGCRAYSAWSPLSSSTRLLTVQAAKSVDPVERLGVASAMFRMRFGDDLPLPQQLDLATLRGLEGARVKATYQSYAARHRLGRWRRVKDGPQLDPVNEALNYANTALYGLCQAVICALGMSPGLGFVHEGNPRAFVLDMADLYKTDLTVPAAFAQAKSAQPGRDVMLKLRKDFHLLRMLPRIVDDIHLLLGVNEAREPDQWQSQPLYLWNSDGTTIPSGDNRQGRDK